MNHDLSARKRDILEHVVKREFGGDVNGVLRGMYIWFCAKYPKHEGRSETNLGRWHLGMLTPAHALSGSQPLSTTSGPLNRFLQDNRPLPREYPLVNRYGSMTNQGCEGAYHIAR